jgi:hypothetical protein
MLESQLVDSKFVLPFQKGIRGPSDHGIQSFLPGCGYDSPLYVKTA